MRWKSNLRNHQMCRKMRGSQGEMIRLIICYSSMVTYIYLKIEGWETPVEFSIYNSPIFQVILVRKEIYETFRDKNCWAKWSKIETGFRGRGWGTAPAWRPKDDPVRDDPTGPSAFSATFGDFLVHLWYLQTRRVSL